jgi:hypothetical protein
MTRLGLVLAHVAWWLHQAQALLWVWIGGYVAPPPRPGDGTLDPRWLTTRLSTCRLLSPRTRVAAVEVQVLQRSHRRSVIRCSLTYEGPGGGPASVVLKVSDPSPANRLDITACGEVIAFIMLTPRACRSPPCEPRAVCLPL